MNRWDEVAARHVTKTDKFANGYGPLYRELCEPLGTEGRILEIGVWRGGSLDLWRELFPDGKVVGVDNGSDHNRFGAVVPADTIMADQGDTRLPAIARGFSPDGFDIIIDDASHLGSLSRATFGLLWPLVVPGGWYVLEDWGVGVPGNDPYYGHYEDDSMLRLAQEFVERSGRYPWRDDADVAEFRGRGSIIAIRKKAS